MFEYIINDIKEKIKTAHSQIITNLNQYTLNIQKGGYILNQDSIDVSLYKDILIAHIINLLLDDESRCVENELFNLLDISDNKYINCVTWIQSNNTCSIGKMPEVEKRQIIDKMLFHCFVGKGKEFINELCSQDIISDNTVAKEIKSVLNNISILVEISSTSADEFIERMGRREAVLNSRIQNTFDREYRFSGALIRNRLFKHKYYGVHYSELINTENNAGRMIDYRIDKNACEFAILHIMVEETGSTGTGFYISEDGYALTCAHVVDGVSEVWANVIAGDGYSREDNSPYEVYDTEPFKVEYVNNDLDIAILKAERPYAYYLPLEKHCLLPDLAEEVVVYGYPLGFEMPKSNVFATNVSYYKGYISSNQIINGNSVTYLDINVKSGNSGSPVISTKTGKVIGIVSGIYLGGKRQLTEKIPYLIPIQHFFELIK